MLNIIKEYGVEIGLIIYFCWRDTKFLSKLESTLDIIKSYLLKDE